MAPPSPRRGSTQRAGLARPGRGGIFRGEKIYVFSTPNGKETIQKMSRMWYAQSPCRQEMRKLWRNAACFASPAGTSRRRSRSQNTFRTDKTGRTPQSTPGTTEGPSGTTEGPSGPAKGP